MSDQPHSYASAGVDIDAATTALKSVGAAVRATHGERVLGGIGGFGACFDIGGLEGTRPVLVSSVDGVGTKTRVAAKADMWDGIGADIVNHCVNDILCQGARPLFFLDYFGCAKLDAHVFEAVVGSAAEACRMNDCALIGGETAEMPGVYHDGEVDIVGAIVGVVDQEKQLPNHKVEEGAAIIGLASSGLHTNGFSLARKVLLESASLSLSQTLPGGSTETIAEMLLAPHRSYFPALWPLVQEGHIAGLAHITGGGFYDNIPRILGEELGAVIHRDRWEVPTIFRAIQQLGDVPDAEMYRVFNMGIGMVAIVAPDYANLVVERLDAARCPAAVIGEVRRDSTGVQIV